MPSHPVRPSVHFLTLVDKSDVSLVRGGEALLLLVVCEESQSRVMVLLAVETVENYLGCREADGWKKKDSIHVTSESSDVLSLVSRQEASQSVSLWP